MKTNIEKHQQANGRGRGVIGQNFRFRTRDVNGNYVEIDPHTGRATTASPQGGTIRVSATPKRQPTKKSPQMKGTLKIETQRDRNMKLQTALKAAGYYTARIDGIIGPKSRRAIQMARENGYRVDEAKGTMTRQKRQLSGPSTGQNMEAVMDHKVRTGVREPYFYVNPAEGMLYRLQGDSILYSTPVATGANKNTDGWAPLFIGANGKGVYERDVDTSSTPAGVFTLGQRQENNTQNYNGEPIYVLREAKRGNPDAILTQVGIHAPATPERQRQLMQGNHFLTYGCVQLPNGEVRCLDNDNNINLGDSVYIEPTVEGNYLYESPDGKIKTYFRETPRRVTGTVWGKTFDRDDVRYNIGY